MNCKNCEESLLSNQNYCFECGAKVIRNRITFKNIWFDISAQFFNIDNKILKTFIDLFSKPQAVICSYINGTRKRYVNVMQYFALSLTLVGIQVFLMNTFFKEIFTETPDFLESLEKMPNSDQNPFLNLDFSEYNNYQSVIYIFSVPISAFSTWLAYFVAGDRRFNFTEHVVLNLYYSSQIIILTSLISILFLSFGLDYFVISGIVSFLTFVYLFYVLHKVFQTKLLESFARFLLIALVYVVFFLGIIAIVAVYTIITKN